MENKFEETRAKCKEAYMNVFMGAMEKAYADKSELERAKVVVDTVFDNAFSLGYDAGYCIGAEDATPKE